MEKCFFPNQGERGEHAGRQGSGKVPSSKGKKKPRSRDTGKGSFVQDLCCYIFFSTASPCHEQAAFFAFLLKTLASLRG